MTTVRTECTEKWVRVGSAEQAPVDGGCCAKVDGKHVAIFNFNNKTEWYAIDNVCPHDNQSVLSRGISGDSKGRPKVACPLHKRSFDLQSGEALGEDTPGVEVYNIKIEQGEICISRKSNGHFMEVE